MLNRAAMGIVIKVVDALATVELGEVARQSAGRVTGRVVGSHAHWPCAGLLLLLSTDN